MGAPIEENRNERRNIEDEEDVDFELPPPGEPPIETIRLRRREASTESDDEEEENDDDDDDGDGEEEEGDKKEGTAEDIRIKEHNKKVSDSEEERRRRSYAWRKSLGNVTAEDLLNTGNFEPPPFCHSFSYAVVSFVPRNSFKSISMEKMRFGFMVKISGLFDSHEAAMDRVKSLCEVDNVFSRFVVPMNNWVPLDESWAALTADPQFGFPENLTKELMNAYVDKAYNQADKIQQRIQNAYYFTPDDESLQDLERYPTNKPRPDRGVETMKTFQRAQEKAKQVKKHEELMQNNSAKHVGFDHFAVDKPESSESKGEQGEVEEKEPLVIDLKGGDPDKESIPRMKQQQYVLFSAFDKESIGPTNCNFNGIMINVRGGFKHKEDAEMCAKDIIAVERITDYTIVSVGNWTVVGDDTAEELDYAAPEARGLMDAIREHYSQHERSYEENIRRGLEINVPDQAKILENA